MKAVIAGGEGFIGRWLVRELRGQHHAVLSLSRNSPARRSAHEVAATDYSREDLRRHLEGADIVVNLAARVHKRGEKGDKHLPAYLEANRDLALRLAEIARAAGARRFVQLSSVAAVSATTDEEHIVGDDEPARPSTPYGMSKLLADEGIATLNGAGFTTVSLRPPAVYGPDAPGPLYILGRFAKFGIPLPLQAAKSLRSIIFVGNLADAISCAAMDSRTGPYIVTDSPPLPLSEIYARMMAASGHERRLSGPFGKLLQRSASAALGRRAEWPMSSAAFDGSRFMRDFNWHPPVPLERAFEVSFGRAEL